jgi:hypothetical protein
MLELLHRHAGPGAARFADVRIEEVAAHFTASAPGDVLEFMRRCALQAIYVFDRQSPDVRIEDALLEEGAKVMAGDGGRIACPSLLLTGTKIRYSRDGLCSVA